MSNPLDHCLERLHLGDNASLRERAKYFQGICSSKVPVKIFSKGPNSQHVVCIQLAYESLGMFGWNTKLAPELAGCDRRTYDTILSAVRKHLNLQSMVTFETLGVTFGSSGLASHAQNLYSFFVEQHISKLSPAQQLLAKEQLFSSLWKGASFYVCAKALGTTLDKSKLQILCGCSSAEFSKSTRLMQQQCNNEIQKLKLLQVARPSRKRKATVESSEEASGETESSEPSHKLAKPPSTRAEKASSSSPSTPPITTSKSKKSTTKMSSSLSESTSSKETSSYSKSSSGGASVASVDTLSSHKKKNVSGIVSMVQLQDYRSSRKYRDYLEWEQQIKHRLIK